MRHSKLLLCATLAAAAFVGGPLYSVPPAWWTTRGVLDDNAQQNDFAVANQAQLKLLATRAYDELQQTLPGGAGVALEAVIKEWYVTDTDGNFVLSDGKRIPMVGPNISNFSPITIGQLKNVAKPFYDRLRESFYWMSPDYPWTQAAAMRNDYAIANIGQLKSLFKFNPSDDSDQDGMPDWWENKYGLNPNLANATADQDGDALSNYGEYLAATIPILSDTDVDGIPDGYEVNHGLDPLSNDSLADKDNDGLTNIREFQITSTNPNNVDSDGDQMPDGWEVFNGLNALLSNANVDSDGDGLTNGWEYILWSLPMRADSDANGVLDRNEDHDGDGLSSIAEINSLPAGTGPFTARTLPASGTWPDRTDTDGNGLHDGFAVNLLGQPGLLREVWTKVGGNQVSDLFDTSRFPGFPTSRSLVSGARSVPSDATSYGQRLRGTLTVQDTARYAFYFTANDSGDLWMRTPSINGNEWFKAGYIVRGASGSPSENSTDSVAWPGLRYPVGSGTVGVNLVAGQQIELDIRQKQNTGSHFVKLRWQKVSITGSTVEDIPSSRFTSWTPTNTDSDGDSLPDWWEFSHFGSLLSEPEDDPDGDGWYNLTELKTGTSPKTRDSDWDSFDEGGSTAFGLVLEQPSVALTQGKLLDFRPISGVNPAERMADADNDFMDDEWERLFNLNPLVDDAFGDLDGDGIPNIGEFLFGFDPTKVDTNDDGVLDNAQFPWALDSDADGLTNQEELITHQTHPGINDTDTDGLEDGWEVVNTLAPRDSMGDNGGQGDPDGDGLSNRDEQAYGTNPKNADTDSDGTNDLAEINQGSNPNDPSDGGNPPANPPQQVTISFGDPSSSNSEKYRINISSPDDPAAPPSDPHYWTNLHFGEVSTHTFKTLKTGIKYTLTMIHIGTSPLYRGKPSPDYDYTLTVADAPCLLVDDPSAESPTNHGMLGSHANDEEPHPDGDFWAGGKEVYLYFPKFEWVTPKASPVTAPDNSIPGQNEFTYDSASPGVLNLEFEVSVVPSGIAAKLVQKNMVFFGEPTTTINGSTFAWATANATPPGKPTVSGDNLKANATYTTLPAANDQFGAKKAHFACTGMELPGGDFEVFFPKIETNHPPNGAAPAEPNWYYYWKQVLGGGNNLEYGVGGGNNNGEVKAMTKWRYDVPRNKTLITIYETGCTAGRFYGVSEYFSGIDFFAALVLHESKHVDQIARADALLPTNGADSFRFGWSWNQSPHNHWTKGPDNAWGVINVNDDGNGVADDAAAVPPFEVGAGDDISLDNPNWVWWPNAWPLPVPNNAPHPIESEAINFSDQNHDEHQSARSDWSNPGKNHNTLDDYAD